MEIMVTRREFLGGLAALTATSAAVGTGAYFLDIPSKMPPPSNLNYLKRLYSVVASRRQQKSDADDILNQGRINFLLLVQGETHEPPEIERAVIGSQTILSIDSNNGTVDEISWTHDLRAPEIERYLKQAGKYDGIFKRIDEAYRFGGFPLMRKSVEAATGLAVDFQIAANDSIIVDLVDKIASGISVENPKSFWAYKIYINGKPYPDRYFPKGKKQLNGVEALQYIKAVPKEDPDPVIEHNRRKYLVMDGLREKICRPLSLLKLIPTLRKATDNGTIAFDGPFSQSIQNAGNVISAVELGRYLFTGKTVGDLLPISRKKIYLVDWAHGDGGMQWVTANAVQNPISKKDLENGVYPPKVGAEVPFDHRMSFKPDPYAQDLVNGYWLPLRRRITELLTR